MAGISPPFSRPLPISPSRPSATTVTRTLLGQLTGSSRARRRRLCGICIRMTKRTQIRLSRRRATHYPSGTIEGRTLRGRLGCCNPTAHCNLLCISLCRILPWPVVSPMILYRFCLFILPRRVAMLGMQQRLAVSICYPSSHRVHLYHLSYYVPVWVQPTTASSALDG